MGRPMFAKMARARMLNKQALADRVINAKKRLLIATFILAILLSLIFFLN